MSEDKSKQRKDVDNKKLENTTKGITFITCPIHHCQYPKGSTCSKCDIEKNKSKNA
ncbi:MAG: hypothetical protein KF721_09705 [Ignavibacteriaceae bacterium]|nr:hypothetical protein [Ignavibacteriaceae bacterium]